MHGKWSKRHGEVTEWSKKARSILSEDPFPFCECKSIDVEVSWGVRFYNLNDVNQKVHSGTLLGGLIAVAGMWSARAHPYFEGFLCMNEVERQNRLSRTW
ncbi:hypothetical protein M9H77_02653 [Catharanthus roseus]|uniref:Uncharacterized protein n=1 Tax=Catharanthus roseus TaxID=4058 RepID=A0ACC0C8Z8_CATRO|nr:hypothetical protein M9H77_02653 [Catharanthus roseus]